MSENKKYQIIDGTMLKLIAMVSMIFDHVGDNFFPEAEWMRAVGRIAMPLFAFCIAEGFIHTGSRKKYILRMLIFALISEIPFDLVTAGKVLEFGHQNIMFTFVWSLVGLMCYDRIANTKEDSNLRYVLGLAVMLVFIILSLFLGLDYNVLAVGLVAIFFILKKKGILIRNGCAILYHIILRNVGIYWYGLLGFIPIFFYNGKKGRGFKWLFYVFYPGHLLIIFLLRTMLMK